MRKHSRVYAKIVAYFRRIFAKKEPQLRVENHSDNHIIAEILAGRETALRRIYPLYAAEFRAWARRFVRCSDEDLTDAYQEALIVFYRNVVTGRLTTLYASLKTYVFVIAFRHLRRAMLKQAKIEIVAEPTAVDLPQDTHFLQIMIEEEEYQAQRQHLSNAIAQLPPACQRVLELYFYQGYSIPQIKEHLNYQSENSVSVQKSRCLKALRDILENF